MSERKEWGSLSRKKKQKKPEISLKPEKPEKKEKSEKKEKTEKAEKADKAEKAEKADKKAKTEKQEGSEKKAPKPKKEKKGKKGSASAGVRAGKNPASVPAAARTAEKRPLSEPDGNISRMAGLFQVLADENRLRILELLYGRELCAADLLQSMDIVQSTMSHHMKLLCESGLVTGEKKGRKVCYRINADGPARFLAGLRQWSSERY